MDVLLLDPARFQQLQLRTAVAGGAGTRFDALLGDSRARVESDDTWPDRPAEPDGREAPEPDEDAKPGPEPREDAGDVPVSDSRDDERAPEDVAYKPVDQRQQEQQQPAVRDDNPAVPAEAARLAAPVQTGARETAAAAAMARSAIPGVAPTQQVPAALQGLHGNAPPLQTGATPQNPEPVAPRRPRSAPPLPPLVRLASSPTPAVARPQGALGTQAALAAQSLATGAIETLSPMQGAIPNNTAASLAQAQSTGADLATIGDAAPGTADASKKTVATRSATVALSAAAAQTARAAGTAPTGQARSGLASVPAAAGGELLGSAGARPLGPLGLAASGLGLSTPLSADYAAPAARPAASPAFAAEQVAVQIHKAAHAGQNKINIRLYPADLGRVEVKLEWTDDGALRAVISAERGDTLDLLQRDSRALDRALQDAGLKTDSNSLSFDLRSHAEGRDKAPDSEQIAPDSPGAEPPSADAIEADADARPRQSAHDGILDLRV